MTPAEVTARDLRRVARLAEDAARFDEAGVAALKPEFDELRQKAPSPETHARLLELYPLVVSAANDADQNRYTATALLTAADMIEKLTSVAKRARPYVKGAFDEGGMTLAHAAKLLLDDIDWITAQVAEREIPV